MTTTTTTRRQIELSAALQFQAPAISICLIESQREEKLKFPSRPICTLRNPLFASIYLPAGRAATWVVGALTCPGSPGTSQSGRRAPISAQAASLRARSKPNWSSGWPKWRPFFISASLFQRSLFHLTQVGRPFIGAAMSLRHDNSAR